MEHMTFEEISFSIIYGYIVLMGLVGYFALEYEKQYWVEYESQ